MQWVSALPGQDAARSLRTRGLVLVGIRAALCRPDLSRALTACFCMRVRVREQFTKLAFADGHDVDGVLVPTEGFNVFGALAPSACAGDAAPGNIYCLGDYKATGDGLDAALDANAKASYVSAAPPARPRFSGCTNAVPCNLSIS